MKKLSLFALFIYLSFFSLNSWAQQAVERAIWQAENRYVQGKFQEAYDLLSKNLDKGIDNWELNFYLGASALELKKYDEAMEAFDRVEILNPDFVRLHLEMARLYYEQGNFELANYELDIALKTNLPDPVRNNALALKKRMKEEGKRVVNGFTIILGVNYDSNANNDIGEDKLVKLTDIALPLGRKKEADYGFAQTLVFNNILDLGKRGGWFLNNQLVGFNKNNSEFSDNDLIYLGVRLAPVYVSGLSKYSFPLELEKVWLEGEEFVDVLGVGASLEYMLTSKDLVKTEVGLKSYSYDALNDDLNSLAKYVSFSLLKAGDSNATYRFNFSYESRSQEKSYAWDNASLTEVTVGFGGVKRFNSKWRGNFNFALQKTTYKEDNVFFESARNDNVKKFELGGSYLFTPKVTSNFGLSYATHNSNHAIYAFDKNLAYANLVLEF